MKIWVDMKNTEFLSHNMEIKPKIQRIWFREETTNNTTCTQTHPDRKALGC